MRLVDADALKEWFSVGYFTELIDEQPTIEERKKGEWIKVDDYYNRISGRCSVCGWEALLYETDVVGMDYCPNCGADMRGVEE